MPESRDPQAYVVRQGECLEQIAYRLGFDAATVWGHEKNDDLRDRCKDNHSILCPGDVLYIPAVDECPALPLGVGQTNEYTAMIPEIVTEIQLVDAHGPLCDEEYILEGLVSPVESKTDGEGKFSFSAPVTTTELRLLLKNYGEFVLAIGEMDPITEMTGVQKRLANLGHFGEAPTGDLDDVTRDGLMRFQRSSDLEMTGDLTADTRAALEKTYGC